MIGDADDQDANVTVDVTQTTFIDSAVVGVLASAWRDGLNICGHGAAGGVRRVLEVSGLLLQLHDRG